MGEDGSEWSRGVVAQLSRANPDGRARVPIVVCAVAEDAEGAAGGHPQSRNGIKATHFLGDRRRMGAADRAVVLVPGDYSHGQRTCPHQHYLNPFLLLTDSNEHTTLSKGGESPARGKRHAKRRRVNIILQSESRPITNCKFIALLQQLLAASRPMNEFCKDAGS